MIDPSAVPAADKAEGAAEAAEEVRARLDRVAVAVTLDEAELVERIEELAEVTVVEEAVEEVLESDVVEVGGTQVDVGVVLVLGSGSGVHEVVGSTQVEVGDGGCQVLVGSGSFEVVEGGGGGGGGAPPP